MWYRITLALGIDYTLRDLEMAAEKKAGAKIKEYRILKKSIDARNKSNIRYSVNLAVNCDKRLNLPEHIFGIESIEGLLASGEYKGKGKRIAVIGSGPAGLFAAMTLAKGGAAVTVFERGESVDERRKSVLVFSNGGPLNEESNIQYGEGGAGTFSDGKLNTGVSGEYNKTVLAEFVRAGANEDILYAAKPHIGTDVLINVVRNMRKTIERYGGKVLFNSKVDGLIIDGGALKGVVAGGAKHYFDCVILACGHSARDTYRLLYDNGVNMERKPFAIGARVEHKQSVIDRAQYGNIKGLPPADYKLSHRLKDGRGCFTFCMCPGGYVMAAASCEGATVTNGMSERARDGKYANSAVLVNVNPEDFGAGDALEGMRFQEKIERSAYNIHGGFIAPAISVRDFIEGSHNDKNLTSTYPRGVGYASIGDYLPDYVERGMREGLKAFNNKLRGFAERGVLVGVESRSSAPVRVLRDERYESNIKSLFPCGEGAGYAGGITSSAIDGIKVALEILKR